MLGVMSNSLKVSTHQSPQELAKRKNNALCQGAVLSCLPGCVNDVGRGREDIDLTLKIQVCGAGTPQQCCLCTAVSVCPCVCAAWWRVRARD